MMDIAEILPQQRRSPHGRMGAQLPWGAIHHLPAQGSAKAVHRCGTPAACPSSKPSGQRQRLTLVEAVAPAEDRVMPARRI
jgi:hypothetical protein